MASASEFSEEAKVAQPASRTATAGKAAQRANPLFPAIVLRRIPSPALVRPCMADERASMKRDMRERNFPPQASGRLAGMVGRRDCGLFALFGARKHERCGKEDHANRIV